jgi:hypothetical protein
MLGGGPQYQLRPGVKIVVFANSFGSTIPPGYLLQGSREELLQRVITSVMPLATCVTTKSRCRNLPRRIVVFSSNCTKSFAPTSVHPIMGIHCREKRIEVRLLFQLGQTIHTIAAARVKYWGIIALYLKKPTVLAEEIRFQ